MYYHFQVAVISALLAFCQAGLIEDGHGQAVSSQSIVRHDEPSQHLGQQQHFTPVLEHGGQILQHSGPILHHAAPVIGQTAYLQHSGPIVHAAPLVQHVAPAIHHTPVVQQYSPVAIGHNEQVEQHVSKTHLFFYFCLETI